MKRRTKIVCTLGPATSDRETIRRMIRAEGANNLGATFHVARCLECWQTFALNLQRKTVLGKGVRGREGIGGRERTATEGRRPKMTVDSALCPPPPYVPYRSHV